MFEVITAWQTSESWQLSGEQCRTYAFHDSLFLYCILGELWNLSWGSYSWLGGLGWTSAGLDPHRGIQHIKGERIFFSGPNTNTNIFIKAISIRIWIRIYSYCRKNIRIYSNIQMYSNIWIYSNISIKISHSICLIP